MKTQDTRHDFRVPLAARALLFALLATTARAEKIEASAILYRDPQFKKEFVGSYGILSEVEPKVSAEEQVLLGKVQELFGKSQFIAAEQEIVRFIKEVEKPTDPEKKPGEISATMVFVLGNLYFSSDRIDEARRAFLEAIRRFPRFRRAHTNLGYLYISKNQLPEASATLQKAVELGESSPRVYGMLGYCYLQDKNALAAENAYRQAYLLDPKNRDWKVGLTQSLMLQEKLAEASSMFETLIAENPEDRQLWLQQANALIGLDRKMDAAVNLEVLRMKGLAKESELTMLGNIYMEQGEAQLALYAYLEATEKAPKLDVARALKSARILNDYGFPEKADALVGKVAKAGNLSSKEAMDLDLVRVKIAQATDDTERVGTLLRDLFTRDSGNPEIRLELARHYDNLAKNGTDEAKRASDLGEAKNYYKFALENPTVAYQANLGLGQLLVREKQYVESLTFIERALSLKTGDKTILEQYLSRVRRAADRETQRKEREATERAAAEEADKKKANSK